MKKKFLFAFAALFVAASAIIGFSSFTHSKAADAKTFGTVTLYFYSGAWHLNPPPTGIPTCDGEGLPCTATYEDDGIDALPEEVAEELTSQNPNVSAPGENAEYNISVGSETIPVRIQEKQ